MSGFSFSDFDEFDSLGRSSIVPHRDWSARALTIKYEGGETMETRDPVTLFSLAEREFISKVIQRKMAPDDRWPSEVIATDYHGDADAYLRDMAVWYSIPLGEKFFAWQRDLRVSEAWHDIPPRGTLLRFERDGSCCWLGGSREFIVACETVSLPYSEQWVAALFRHEDKYPQLFIWGQTHEEHAAQQECSFTEECLKWIERYFIPVNRNLVVRGLVPPYPGAYGTWQFENVTQK